MNAEDVEALAPLYEAHLERMRELDKEWRKMKPSVERSWNNLTEDDDRTRGAKAGS